MTEWGVVTVIIALVGLIAAICGPVVKNTRAMTELTVTMRGVAEELKAIKSSNSKAHERIWAHEEEQDDTLQNHEIRISKLEDRNGRKE